jgi:hypothetical protein
MGTAAEMPPRSAPRRGVKGVMPVALEKSGYVFRFPKLEGALAGLLG